MIIPRIRIRKKSFEIPNSFWERKSIPKTHFFSEFPRPVVQTWPWCIINIIMTKMMSSIPNILYNTSWSLIFKLLWSYTISQHLQSQWPFIHSLITPQSLTTSSTTTNTQWRHLMTGWPTNDKGSIDRNVVPFVNQTSISETIQSSISPNNRYFQRMHLHLLRKHPLARQPSTSRPQSPLYRYRPSSPLYLSLRVHPPLAGNFLFSSASSQDVKNPSHASLTTIYFTSLQNQWDRSLSLSTSNRPDKTYTHTRYYLLTNN